MFKIIIHISKIKLKFSQSNNPYINKHNIANSNNNNIPNQIQKNKKKKKKNKQKIKKDLIQNLNLPTLNTNSLFLFEEKLNKE